MGGFHIHAVTMEAKSTTRSAALSTFGSKVEASTLQSVKCGQLYSLFQLHRKIIGL